MQALYVAFTKQVLSMLSSLIHLEVGCLVTEILLQHFLTADPASQHVQLESCQVFRFSAICSNIVIIIDCSQLQPKT